MIRISNQVGQQKTVTSFASTHGHSTVLSMLQLHQQTPPSEDSVGTGLLVIYKIVVCLLFQCPHGCVLWSRQHKPLSIKPL